MTRALEMMWNAISATADWFVGVLEEVDPGLWTVVGLVAAALLLVTLVWRALRAPRKLDQPELIVTLGKIKIENAEAKNAYGEPDPVFALAMTISNLNRYPVQILELSLKSGDMALPLVAEVGELVPPNSSLKVQQTLTGLWGEGGRLELYFYAASNVKRYFRLQGEFLWEPWHGFYKINPSGQSISRVKRLASESVRRARERQWRQEEAERKREKERAEREARQARAREEALVRQGHKQDKEPQTRAKPHKDREQDTPAEQRETPPAGRKLDFPDKF